MNYKQRDLVLVKFPFTDLTGFKVRPALIISNSSVHKSKDYIIMMITTQKIGGSFGVAFDNTDLTIPLKAPVTKGYIYTKKLAVLDESIIYKKISEFQNLTKFQNILDLHIDNIALED
ncbi:type II toxin-antitoxin system PemK/MazF family toxin [Myroides profundi]|uniref:mRNA interferase MazF n=1 Tax=Myroides profundi TaxID=480520 RepID=A0AAJ4W1G0_MYRPR|nr:type II toxin-antitoxin system PemK/MazF family toxin [Myroides profundi]SEP95306.1 mRNA interferase MazF [Myroides profundi]